MGIVSFMIYVLLIGFLLWLGTTYVPMDDKIKKFLVVAVLMFLVLWLLNMIGVVNDMPIPRVR